jgi:hypothetical protein
MRRRDKQIEALRAHIAEQERLIWGLAERLAAASECLTWAAERMTKRGAQPAPATGEMASAARE